ncbi:MAG: hypothetical protein WC869_15890 [Phycisphaerae bacterium]|jgi:hypothetical protein
MKYWIVSALLVLGGSLQAVSPVTWTQDSEAEFSGGEFKSTVLTSTGQVALSREISILMPSAADLPDISAVATDGKAVFAASAGSGAIYRMASLSDKKGKRWATLSGAIVTAMVWTDKGLLAGSGGQGAGLYAIDPAGKVSTRWSDPNVNYIWSILPGPEGKTYIGTGPEASVYSIDADGNATRLYKDGKLAKNILSLAAGKDGLLYAGTDESGLVIEINTATKASRVVLDAEEKEISSLICDGAGGIFAATSDADKAGGDGEEPAGAAAMIARIRKAAPTSRPASPAPKSPPSEGESEDLADEEATPATHTATSAAAPRAKAPKPTSAAARMRAALAKMRTTTTPPEASDLEGPGNAVYYIRPDGLVRCIFRKPVTILAMMMLDKQLILGTGNSGSVYAVSPDGQEAAQLANTDAKQVTSLTTGPDGSILFGTANKGSLGKLGAGLAKSGTYISKVQDAQQICQWGTAQVRAKAPAGSEVTFATRSGNLAEADDETWSPWSAPMPVSEDFLQVASPNARFLQYRLAFSSTDKAAVPSVGGVEILYQMGNLPPVVSAVTVKPSASGHDGGDSSDAATAPQPFRAVSFTATDVNNDTMVYKIEFRPVGSEQWIEIADKLDATNYSWDTRTVGDGVYELRVTASDSPSNPPASALSASQISAPVVADNTAPVVKLVQAKVDGRNAGITGSAQDASSRLTSIAYALDSQNEWVAVLPDGGICDSSSENFSFQLKDLKAGAHRIAIKVTDLYGNTGYATVSVTAQSATNQPTELAPLEPKATSKPTGR